MVSVIFFQPKHKKSENSSYIPINYYNKCNLLTTKRGKNAKIKREGKEERRGEEEMTGRTDRGGQNAKIRKGKLKKTYQREKSRSRGRDI